MPILSKEQIAEVEFTLGDLLDQLEAAEYRADKAEEELRRIRAAYPEIP